MLQSETLCRKSQFGERLQLDAVRHLYPNLYERSLITLVGENSNISGVTQKYMERTGTVTQGRSAKLQSIAQQWPQSVYNVPRHQIIKVLVIL